MQTKIQLKHFSAMYKFTDLFVTPYDSPKRNSTPVLVKPWHWKIKQYPVNSTLHLKLLFRHPDRCTGMPFHTLVVLDTPFHSAKVQPCTPFQSKVNLTHVEFHFLPIRWPEIHPWNLLHWLSQIHLLAYIPLKHCLKILIN